MIMTLFMNKYIEWGISPSLRITSEMSQNQDVAPLAFPPCPTGKAWPGETCLAAAVCSRLKITFVF